MDIRKVKKLIELLEESGISEIEIHEGEESVRVSRAHTAPAAGLSYMAPAQGPVSAAAMAGADSEAAVETDGHVVRAPMVGLFYEAAGPGKPAFVTLGQTVRKGDVLCVIEAMKIMNQIEADVGGVIAKIHVENGDPVEYGQPLFVIRES